MVCSVFSVVLLKHVAYHLLFVLAGDQNMVSGVRMMMEDGNLHRGHLSQAGVAKFLAFQCP